MVKVERRIITVKWREYVPSLTGLGKYVNHYKTFDSFNQALEFALALNEIKEIDKLVIEC